jgi:acid phosphatase type 7
MRSIWSGIEGMIGIHWLQFFFFGLLTVLMIGGLIAQFIPLNKIVLHILIDMSFALLIALSYMLYLGIDSLRFFIRAFVDILMVMMILYFVYFIIFRYPSCKLSKNKLYKRILFGTFTALLIVITFDLEFHFVTNKPVVYAVEDTYQIVWTTSTNATAWVTIGEETYYDLYAGSEISETTVHKVVVPMSDLDLAKSYTIHSKHMIFRGPYSGIEGGSVSSAFAFRPVDLSDGLNYYTVSDTHTRNQAASEAAGYFGADLDFLILGGDIMNHIETASDAELILQLGFEITQGEIPVIYARGNHEVKSTYSDQLHRYVGSLNEKFYYTFNLSGVFGVVLDLGEDHDDTWWEYYDTVHFDLYREEQTAFLSEVVSEAAYDDPSIQYRMGICHIPVALVDEEYLADFQEDWTTLLNQMDLNIMVSGHKHQLLAFTTNIPAYVTFDYHDNYSAGSEAGYRTDANFDNFVASRRADSQLGKENLFGKVFTGMAVSVDFATGKMTILYTNHLKEIVPVVHPYTGVTISEFVIDL